MTEVDWPIPPAAIRYRVVSPEQHSEQAFLELSQAVALSIEEGLRAVGRKIHDFKTVLDWGAGCGRVLRYWRPLLNRIDFCGSDVDRDAIEWDQANLPGVEWRLNDPLPPLTWLDDTFDFIFGVSVFTHLDVGRQRLWAAELARVSKPQAIVMLSTHGPFSFDYTNRAAATPSELHAFDVEGYLHIQNISDGVMPDWYQTTFQRRGHLEKAAAPQLVALTHLPQGMTGFQDLTVFEVKK